MPLAAYTSANAVSTKREKPSKLDLASRCIVILFHLKDHSLLSDDGKVVLGNENLEEDADVECMMMPHILMRTAPDMLARS